MVCTDFYVFKFLVAPKNVWFASPKHYLITYVHIKTRQMSDFLSCLTEMN